MVDSNEFLIGHNGKTLWGDLIEVTPENKWGFGNSPESEVGLLLLEVEPSISDFKHVGIVPSTGLRFRSQQIVGNEVVLNRGQYTLDVSSSPPAVASLGTPFTGILKTPVAY